MHIEFMGVYEKETDKRTDGRMDGRLVIQTDGVNCKHDR